MCFCLGEGELRPQIEQEIHDLGLEGKVILTGIRSDVPDFMSVLDVLIFPSKFEGLPLTLIEAQAAGLPSLISDTITKDVIVTDGIVERMSIEADPAVWAERAVEVAGNSAAGGLNQSGDSHDHAKAFSRVCQYDKIAAAGYDIHQLAGWYEDFFNRLVEEHDSQS